MVDDSLITEDDFAGNPTARVPVCLCLDVSASMGGEPIRELNRGVEQFYSDLNADEVARYSAEIAIVTFGRDGASCVSDFVGLSQNSQPPQMEAGGMTPMGEAVNMALDMLDARKKRYQDKGVDYYQPWLVIMTDGEPNGDPSELTRAINRTAKLQSAKKLVLFPIGVGTDADMCVLAKFSPQRAPLRLKGLNFSAFFAWLSQSISRTSQSIPGETVSLDSPKGWASL